MKKWLEDKIPPGADIDSSFKWFKDGLIVSSLISIGFFFSYINSYNDLFRWNNGKKVENLWETYGTYMDGFWDIADFWFIGFLILTLMMIVLVFRNYSSFTNGSHSIYVMKRLPEGSELHIRCLTLPLITITGCIVAALILLALYYLFYMLVTPDTAICPNIYGRLFGTGMSIRYY